MTGTVPVKKQLLTGKLVCKTEKPWRKLVKNQCNRLTYTVYVSSSIVILVYLVDSEGADGGVGVTIMARHVVGGEGFNS